MFLACSKSRQLHSMMHVGGCHTWACTRFTDGEAELARSRDQIQMIDLSSLDVISNSPCHAWQECDMSGMLSQLGQTGYKGPGRRDSGCNSEQLCCWSKRMGGHLPRGMVLSKAEADHPAALGKVIEDAFWAFMALLLI